MAETPHSIHNNDNKTSTRFPSSVNVYEDEIAEEYAQNDKYLSSKKVVMMYDVQIGL